jgi:hypothetical protein
LLSDLISDCNCCCCCCAAIEATLASIIDDKPGGGGNGKYDGNNDCPAPFKAAIASKLPPKINNI